MESRFLDKEHLIMLVMAASIFLFNIIGFIVCYFVWREYGKESEYMYRNGRNLLNFHISYVIYEVIAGISIIAVVGVFILPILSIVYLALTIFGMIKYGLHENYNYPLTIGFIK